MPPHVGLGLYWEYEGAVIMQIVFQTFKSVHYKMPVKKAVEKMWNKSLSEMRIEK